MNEKQYNTAVSRVRSLATDIYRDAKSACAQLALWAVEEYDKGEYRQAMEFAKSSQKHARVAISVRDEVALINTVPSNWEEELKQIIEGRAEIATRFMVAGNAERSRYWVDSVNKWKSCIQKLHEWDEVKLPVPASSVTEGGAR